MIQRFFLQAAFLCFLFSFSAKGNEYASFQQIDEVVSGWKPNQHLWVNGQLRVGAAQLNELESWLDENGSNWTIVLMQNARGQRYERKTGMTAVEFALGTGLSNETAFGQSIDPRTRETNGAVFVLFLEERKFSYFASEVYDSRSLGERYWVNRLDRPAVAAMRSGGRIIDAVKDTVTSIETSLTRKIEAEQKREMLAAIEREEAIAEAKKYPDELRPMIQQAVDRTEELRTAHLELIGPIIRPNLSSWEASLETIARLAEQKDARSARRHFEETRESIVMFQRGLDRWEEDKLAFPPLEAAIAAVPSPEGAPRISGHLSRATGALNSAKENHARGETLYRTQLQTARREWDSAKVAHRSWEEEQQQNQFFRRLLSGITGFAATVWLFVLNRLRRPEKREAQELLARWKEQLRGKFDTLFQLMDRTSLLVGSSRDLAESTYAGTTETLAKETIRGVDELFIMSAATDRVVAKAEALIEPSSFGVSLRNRFSSKNYRKALELLSSKPIGFAHTDHLEEILSPATENEPRTLLGEKEDYQPFHLSFEQLIAAYDEKQTTMGKNVNRLEAGINGLPVTWQRLLLVLEQVEEKAGQLAFTAKEDNLFPLVALQNELIPFASDTLTKSEEFGDTDPVRSFENNIPECTRLVSEAESIVHTISSFRSIDLPVIKRIETVLQEKGRQTSWLDRHLESFIARSETLSQKATSYSIEEEWAELDDDLTRVKGTAIRSETLCDRIEDELRPALAEAEAELIANKAKLSTLTGLPPEDLLEESGLAPGAKLKLASFGIETALAAIDRGDSHTSDEELREVENCLEEASTLMALSYESAHSHREIHSKLKAELQKLRAEQSQVTPLFESLQIDYAPAVLLFSSRFGTEISGQRSIADSLERCQKRLDSSFKTLNTSEEKFREGALIHAYGLLETAENELGFAAHQLALVRDQHEAAREAEEDNIKTLAKLESDDANLALLSKDRKTCASTVEQVHAFHRSVAEFNSNLKTSKPDPFAQSRTGDELKKRSNELEDSIHADWKAHDIADSATTGAKAALTFCNNYLREAKRDGITDSLKLTKAIERHAELTKELATLSNALKTPHREWSEIFAATNLLTTEVGRVRSVLEEELAAARDAAARIMKASEAVSDLHAWRSSYRVNPNRNAGISGLARAKQRLARGHYGEARKAAIGALGEAIRELQRAKTKEAEKERAAAAARRAAARRASFSSSGSSFSSRSSSSFSSSSRSSFSSGSGFSRSGW